MANLTFTINQKLEHIVKTFSLSLKRHLNPLVGYQRGTVIDTTPVIVTFQSGCTTEHDQHRSVQLNSKEINSLIFSESILNDLVSEQSPHISVVD